MNQRHTSQSVTIAGAIVLTILILVSVTFYYLFFEKPWLRYLNVPFSVLSNVNPGGPVPLHIIRCNDDSVEHVYTVAQSMERVTKVGEAREFMLLANVMVSIRPGCSEGDSVILTAPKDTRPGMWQLVGTSEISGTLKNHLVEWRSVPFEVKAVEGLKQSDVRIIERLNSTAVKNQE
jgi:hypothetical protein